MDRITLGQYIAARRKSLFLTQEELAEKMLVSKSAIAKWETDGGIPDRDNLYKLAEIFDVSINELHRIINSRKANETDLMINITPDVITFLESYDYKVIRPGENEKQDD